VSRIYEGTNEINRTYIASRLVKKAEAGLCSLEAASDSFVSELAGKAVKRFDVRDQVSLGAMSDLVMLTYTEQSARLRATDDATRAAHERFCDWANLHAAEAYGRVTGEAVTIPAPSGGHTDLLAEAVIAKRGPIVGRT
jgi:hypothetical protein